MDSLFKTVQQPKEASLSEKVARQISELIKDGDTITTEVVTDKNRYGQVVRYARYRRGF